ncbi:NAD(P)/FAD-dependent oxidoreductase [Acinetobacter larvae]|uniref:FAD-dependent oxidoreductase n=1 Tax=Acinetobacter larvae TaxID=1789224 RepID=A0A1B2LYN5_9GAMM|nr:NAD(P)/FAD-dependent oxidoreductase [Acinetobacter larvae]AOA58068.1 FAD-dependent oxidoreductase [Acinetobacter larvae]
MSQQHRIVIVGGGAGGLELATQLGNRLANNPQIEISLVDKKLTHIWKPLLHEIAAGTLNINAEETNYYAHAAKHHYQFIWAKLEQIDAARKCIILKTQSSSKSEQGDQQFELHYDTLILAVGSISNDFGTPGVKQYCHYLDSLQQAQTFQQDLLHLYLDAQHHNIDRELHIGIIGAGATGVELAAELVQAKKNFYQYGLNKIKPNQVKISLIEGAPRILPALSEKMSKHCHKHLERMGVQVLTNKRVAKIDAERIYFSDDTSIIAELKVWAAGIKAPPVIANLEGFAKDRMGRLEVFATLQTKSDPNIFAFGDCAHCIPDASQPPLAPRAQVASQQASFLVDAMLARIKGAPQPMFQFNDRGSLVSLTRSTAFGEVLGQVNVQGFIAKSMYVSLYRLHQATIYGYTHAGLLATKDFMTRKIAPKIKLH